MRLTLALVVVVALGATFLLLRSKSVAPAPLSAAESDGAVAEAPAMPSAEIATPARVEATTAPTVTEASLATAALAVEVVDSKGAGVFKASVLLLQPRDEGTTRIHSADTDPEGFAELVVPSGKALTIAAGRYGETTNTEVEVAALAAGEVRELVISVTERASTSAEVLVRVHAPDGAPIAGATLHTSREAGFSLGGQPLLIPPSGTPAAVTDSLGEARVVTEALASTIALVRADGRAPQIVTLRDAVPTDTPPPTVDVTLTPAARAEGHVTGAPAGARARAVGPGYGLQHDASRSRVFLGRDVQFEVEVGPDGTFVLEDLATGAPLRFELAHEKKVLVVEPDAVTLAAGEVQLLDWRVGAGAVARCVVREEDGTLATGIGVWLLSSDEGRPGLAESYWKFTQRRPTDASGTVTFDPVQSGSWVVALEPLEPRLPENEAYAPISVVADLRDETQATTIELTLVRARYIRGVIVDPQGKPYRGHLMGYGPDGIFLSESSGTDGAFKCGPLVPGVYELTARVHPTPEGELSYGPSAAVKAEAGAEGVELRLQPGGALTVTASRGGEQVKANFTATAAPYLSAQGYGGKPKPNERFTGLGLGTYVVTATTADRHIGVIARFELTTPGEQSVDVPLEPSGAVRIRNAGPHKYLNCNVSIGGTAIFAGTALAGGEEAFELPPGPARVVLSVYDQTSTAVPRPKIFEEVHDVVVVAREEVVIDVTD